MSFSHHGRGSSRMRVALAAWLGITTLGSSILGCTSCESWGRDRYVALGGVTRTFAVPIARGESVVRYRCSGSAVSERADAWNFDVSWRAPTGVPSGAGLSFRVTYDSNPPTARDVSGACDGGTCSSVDFGGYASACDTAGRCETPTTIDVEVLVGDPLAIPAQGLATELVVQVGVFAKVASDGGGLDQPQPADADVSDVDVQVDCVRVAP